MEGKNKKLGIARDEITSVYARPPPAIVKGLGVPLSWLCLLKGYGERVLLGPVERVSCDVGPPIFHNLIQIT